MHARRRVVAVGSPMLDSYIQVTACLRACPSAGVDVGFGVRVGSHGGRVVQVDEAFITAHGLRKGDALPLPRVDLERVLAAAAACGDLAEGPGGVAGNTVKVLGRLGNPAVMVGMAGDDQVRPSRA